MRSPFSSRLLNYHPRINIPNSAVEPEKTRDVILSLIEAIEPYDDLELEHKNDVLAWIKSGAQLFRIAKPDNPPKHLVSYFVLFDDKTHQIMLIDHVNAELWLPAGGHVEINENPETTVVREAMEELTIDARFDTVFGSCPLFVTVTETKGTNTHTDVSLWYVIGGDSSHTLIFDRAEMNSYKWLSFDEVSGVDISELDPHMHRFVGKMQKHLSHKQ